MRGIQAILLDFRHTLLHGTLFWTQFFDSVLAENSYEILEVLQLSRLFILDLMSHLKETLQVSDEGIEKLISCSNFMNLMALKILQFYSQEVGWDSHLDENLLASLTFNLALSE